MSPDSRGRRPGGRWIVDLMVILGVLVSANLVVALGAPQPLALAAQLVAATMAVIGARKRGYSCRQLGLTIGYARPGLRLGGLVSLVIVASVTAIASLPGAGAFFEDDRFADIGAADVAFEAAIRIPLVTALTEEILFRSVLFAVLLARSSLRPAVLATSLLFALWHLPTASADLATASMTLLATGVAGLVLAWLRLRSGSIIAPWMAHAVLNSSVYVVGAALQSST